jgi:integrase
VQLLIRLCGEQGALIRATLRRDQALKLPLPPSPGRPYSAEEKARMLEEAQKLRTPQMHAALALDLNTGLRDKELREIRWEQIDLVNKKALTVGKSKTEAGGDSRHLSDIPTFWPVCVHTGSAYFFRSVSGKLPCPCVNCPASSVPSGFSAP